MKKEYYILNSAKEEMIIKTEKTLKEIFEIIEKSKFIMTENGLQNTSFIVSVKEKVSPVSTLRLYKGSRINSLTKNEHE